MDTIDLKTFLKQYTTISNTFLDEFLDFYNVETTNNDFIIDIVKVANWLGTVKGKIKETLKNSYKLNVDYKVIKTTKEKKGSGGRNEEIVLLTPECFKKICQLTRTKKGDQVREYFIELEGIINDYKSYIIKGLQDRIKQLENNQKPYTPIQKGIIYVFTVTDKNSDSLYKIGRTKNLKNRMSQHNSSNADNIDILYKFQVNDVIGVEKCMKMLMKEYQYRKYKEVYQININIIKKIIKDCKKITSKYKKDNISREQLGGNIYSYIEYI